MVKTNRKARLATRIFDSSCFTGARAWRSVASQKETATNGRSSDEDPGRYLPKLKTTEKE